METMNQVAKRGFGYFLSSRQHGSEIAKGRALFGKVLGEHGQTYHPFRMGILLSVYVAETDEQAWEESSDAIFYFIKNCFKGHLRQEGRSMLAGAGIPNLSVDDYRKFLASSRPGAPMLGDVKDAEELRRAQSILVGSPDTVFRTMIELVEIAKVGNLLIQFHIGDMKSEHARKSMELFAKHVAPRLREESARIFARDFPDMERELQDRPL